MKRRIRTLLASLAALTTLAATLGIATGPAAGYGGFEDVQRHHFYADAVAWMSAEGISGGTTPGCFSPEAPITRAQAVTFLHRLDGEPSGGSHPFVDVREGWQRQPVAWAYATGITGGVDAQHFEPDVAVTRGDFAALLYRYDGADHRGTHPFADVAFGYQQSPVAWMHAEGITSGVDTANFAPHRTITRGEAATMLWRYAGRPSVAPVPDEPCGAGLPAGDYVTPASVGNTVGPGAVAPAPTQVVGGRTISGQGTVLQNVVVDGCLVIKGDDVTIRNVVINCGNSYPIRVAGADDLVVEHTRIDCEWNGTKGILFEGATDFVIDRVEITRCDDSMFIERGVGSSRITNSVFRNQNPASKAHTDGMQIGTFDHTAGRLVVEGNWWQYNRSGCCANGVLFLSGQSRLTVEMRNNFLDHDFGVHVLRCQPAATCLIENNTINGTPSGFFAYAASNGGTARCNRFTDGTLVPHDLHQGFIVDNRNC